MNTFAVAKQPNYRRLGALRLVQDSPPEVTGISSAARAEVLEPVSAEEWERFFGGDVLSLVSETLTHICGDSCFKYSGDAMKMICRHGFYYIIMLETGGKDEDHWKKRRRGKPLRNALFVVKATYHGMQGRTLLVQEHPLRVHQQLRGSGGHAL